MSVNAVVNYHVKSTDRQAFEFDVGGIIGNLVSPELVPTEVQVEDLRDGKLTVNFFDDGITFENHVSRIDSFEERSDWREIYDKELARLLKDKLRANEVIIFDHTVRIDDPNAERKPARNVHNDYSEGGANQRLMDLVGQEKAEEFKDGHFAFVNVWRPVEQQIFTSPLGFIRPKSISPDDWMKIDLIYPDRIGEILGVAKSKNHQWFYLSNMTPNEVAIFNIYDNKDVASLGHSALDLVGNDDQKHIRKSIESRTLIRYS